MRKQALQMVREEYCRESNQQVQRPWGSSMSGCLRYSKVQRGWSRIRGEVVGDTVRHITVQLV